MLLTPILVGSSLLAFGDFTIEEVLPSETIFVCSVDNAKNVCETALTEKQRTEIHTTIKEAFGVEDSDMCDYFTAQCAELIAKAEIDDDWKPSLPAGYAGFALYPVADFELGTISFALLGVAEINDPNLIQFSEAMVESVLENNSTDAEIVNLAGEDVVMIPIPFDPTALQGMPLGLSQTISFDRVYFASVNGYLVCGTDPDGISRAIAATNGDTESVSLASNETYTAMMDQVGSGNLQAALLTDNLADALLQTDTSNMLGMFLPMLKTAIGDIDGFAETVTVGPSDDVFLQARYTLWMPEGRNGLLGLASTVSEPTKAPSFVGDDTVSYAQMNVDFDKLGPWVRGLMAMNPMMPMPPQQLEAMEQGIAAAVAPLGNTMHVVSTISLPLTDTSIGFLLAVECKDGESMETYLSTTMPLTGSEPRDFLGYRIYPIELPNAGMMSGGLDMSMSLAVGGGWAMLGMTHSVEHALRIAADPAAGSTTEVGNDALHHISTEKATGWGFGNMGESLLAGSEVSEQQMDTMLREMETFDPEMAAEMRTEFDKQMKTQRAINELLASFLGSAAWTMEAHDEGFVANAVLMRP
ncbi:MAG: hypothetical protein QGI78_07710 [Phycisphaerales bacterium]|jgi:hypothetical protein|nr:hypothetical protein [Phycisphaerales bacterium]